MSTVAAPVQILSGRNRALTAADRWIVVAVIVGLFTLAAGISACRKDIARGFDEVAQTSYVAQLQSTGEIWPKLETMRLLDPSSFRFTDQANYLNHPPFYYVLLARLGPRLEEHPQAIIIHRLLNVLVAALGLAALMAIGLLAQLPRHTLYAYCIPIACIPVLAPLAGAIQNDNVAFAAGAGAMLAVWRLTETGSRPCLLVALAAVVVAAWAKLTGLLLVGVLVGGVLGWMMLRQRLPRVWIVPIALAMLIAAAPYLIFMVQYGSPVPNTPAQIALIESGAQVAGWDHTERLSLPAYTVYFMLAFIVEWIPTLAPRSTLNYAMLAIPVATGLCAIAGTVLSARRLWRGEDNPIDVVIVAGALAVAATLAIHIFYSYSRHLTAGWMMDTYPRYYLPLAAIVPLAGLSLLAAIREPRKRVLLMALLIAGPVVFRLLGAPLG